MGNSKVEFIEASRQYTTSKDTIKRGVLYARACIQDILNKFPKEVHPAELVWAFSGINYINYEFRDANGKKLLYHENPIADENILTFYILSGKRFIKESTLTTATMPASLIMENPVAVSSYARGLIRNEQAKQQDKKSTIAEKLSQVEQEIAALEEKKRTLLSQGEK